MSDPPRRQPPSPLVFSPESVLPPISAQSASQQKHGSGSNTVSMPFIKRHVTRRLKTAKQECDKDLQRVTNAITTFFEEKLREGDIDHDQSDAEMSRDTLPYNLMDNWRSAVTTDEASSDGGYDAEFESNRHSRQRASPVDEQANSLTRWSSSPGLYAASLSSSPGSLRRQSTLPAKERGAIPIAISTSSSSALSPSDASPRRNNAGSTSAWASQNRLSRRLSRSIHIPMRVSRSGQSSRSTSRSRSPLPGNNGRDHVSTSPNRRASRILVDDPVDPIMTTLYAIIGVATDITEMTIAQITAQPNLCSQLVQRVQQIGKAWDEHPEWQGRNWYVQVLLAVASLSRVVEWWEAEKQFWNFDDDDDDDEQTEPFAFLLRPADEASAGALSSMERDADVKHLSLSPETDSRMRLARGTSHLGQVREDIRKASIVSDKDADAGRPVPRHPAGTESARVLATERLRLQAEQAQNQNIVIELSLDGDHFVWINYAWAVVVGSEPEEMFGTRISQVLAPTDWNVFRDATQQLLADDSHTMEVRFRLQVQPQSGSNTRGVLYREMEGKGMLMLDQLDGKPSHTMWVVKPIGSPAYDQAESIMEEADKVVDGVMDKEEEHFSDDDEEAEMGEEPMSRPLSTGGILCRICECSIPEWFFEKHNETCSDVHKFEADIGECNESISELRNTIRDLRGAVDHSSPTSIPEYRGMAILSPTSSPSSSALHLFRPPLVSKMQRMSVRRMQRRLLEQLEDILQIASEVSVPTLKEEESKEPIERQRLLSPSSERKILQVRNWSRPSSEDPALQRLISDTETLMRTKMDNVIRMQNTIRYSEKVRQEWEERFEQSLAAQDEDGEEEVGEEGEVDDDDDDDQASTKSEYAFGRETAPSEPTPMASCGLTPIPSNSPAPSSGSNSGSRSPLPAPVPVQSSYQAATAYFTRSSTPSSISSPLALAEPIIAREESEHSSESTSPDEKVKTLARRKSQLLEPKLTVTPPISPQIFPRDANGNGNGAMRHRRLSTVNTLVSPNAGPLSPRIPVAPTKSTPTTIKDFEIIKPISKGAFGSVFLAKKRVTGDYFAIKVLRKADMIAKNQITNIKAERMILMNQAESPFVAKLYFTFQSKENLYLVMEYLNGGDCAALIKSIGALPEEWTKNYIAEVILGLEYLHQRGIIHRDLKPDNLLIDQHGHLKLTDFGLSRIGLLGRQTRTAPFASSDRLRPRTRYSPGSRPPSMDSAYLASPLLTAADIMGGSYFTQKRGSSSHIAVSPTFSSSGTPLDDVSDTSGSDQFTGFFLRRPPNKLNDSPHQSFASELTNDLRAYNVAGLGTPPGEQKFVGTPDYLAPESILGICGDDATVDWWALGVITYEFLYGFPPFHDDTPEKVFENILSGRIDWHEEYIDFSHEAWEFMKELLTVDTQKRLGANGADEVKRHPFFDGIDWEAVTKSEAQFIPQVTDPESTDYFDLRGASTQLFHDDDVAVGESATTPGSVTNLGASVVGSVPIVGQDRSHSPAADDFGSFSFKNLPVLKQANDDVIRKLKTDQLQPLVHTLSEPAQIGRPHRRSVSQKFKKPPSVVTSIDGHRLPGTNPPSPATSVSSVASSPSRASATPSTPASTAANLVHVHSRKPSEFNAIERFKQSHYEMDGGRRNSMPSRLRTASVSTNGEGSNSDHWPASVSHASSQFESSTPPSSTGSVDLRRTLDPSDRALTCLLAEDNPITAKILETLLIRLGCRVVVVSDGSEAISVAHGDIKFDCILMDLQMPVVDGESAARHIKSTSNRNSTVPIISCSAYGGSESMANNTLFAASLSKPVSKADLLAVMRQLGFKTSSSQDGSGPGATAHRAMVAVR